MSSSRISEERLRRLVERGLELQEDGHDFSVEELCAGDVDLIDAVRDSLAGQAELELWAKAPAARNGHPAGDGLDGRVLVGRYRLETRIGAGAMGTVYRAYDLELKRGVAIKLLQSHLFGAPEAEGRFAREAEVLAKLRHPNVVAVHDRGKTEDGLHFLVMELLTGVPLSVLLAELEDRVEDSGWDAVRDTEWVADALRGVELPERSFVRLCARWAADLSAGLAAVHHAGIYHRDVKPSNVLIADDGRALLLDFGIATSSDDATLTVGESTLGTPRYMAPEQASGTGKPGPRFDIYSLAATLYHLLAARAPYDGDVHAVLMAVQRDDPKPLGKCNRSLPVDLQAIVECGMARDAARRYATAAGFADDLQAFLDHRPVVARRRGPVARFWGRARRSRLAQAVVLAGVVASLAVGGVAWAGERASRRGAEMLGLWAGMPPMLGLSQREPVITDLELRAELRSRLDLMVDLVPDHLAARTLRAVYRHDHGDAPGAADDMAAIAQRQAGEYARALAERYRSVADRESALDLTELPEPASDGERFLAGFHAMRAGKYQAAADTIPIGSGELAAREYGLLARMNMGFLQKDQAALREVYDQALLIEGAHGRKIARTRHIIGMALSAMSRFEEAREPFEDLVELAPAEFAGPLNLGVARRATGRFVEACTALERALELRPDSSKALSELAKARASLHQFDAALDTASSIEVDALRHECLAFCEFTAVFAAHDVVTAEQHAATALDHYDVVAELGYETRATRMNASACRALLDKDNDGLCVALLEILAEDPDSPVHLANLALQLPDRPSTLLVDALRDFLDALAASMEGTVTSTALRSVPAQDDQR